MICLDTINVIQLECKHHICIGCITKVNVYTVIRNLLILYCFMIFTRWVDSNQKLKMKNIFYILYININIFITSIMQYFIFNSFLYVKCENLQIKFLPSMNYDNCYDFNLFFSLVKQFKFDDAIVESEALKIKYPLNSDIYYNIGVIYHILKKYNLMEKNYIIAIELGNSDAMNNFGFYHKNVTNDYDLAVNYYMLAMQLDNGDAINNLGFYYRNVCNDFEMAINLYLIAIIKYNNSDAMNNLGHHYYSIKNYVLAEKYFLMAVDLGNSEAINSLGYYHHTVTNKNDLAEKYYLEAINLNNCNAMNNLGIYYCTAMKNEDLAEKYLKMGAECGNKNANINLTNFYIKKKKCEQ